MIVRIDANQLGVLAVIELMLFLIACLTWVGYAIRAYKTDEQVMHGINLIGVVAVVCYIVLAFMIR